MRTYAINEVFYSLQGEGTRAGAASVFVRFQGCNLRCDVEPGERSPGGFRCDTEFASGRKLTAAEVLAEVLVVRGRGQWVVLTGGEPLLQLDGELVAALKGSGLRLAVETNGTIDPAGLGLDWVTLSPKVAEHAVRCRRADELKYVRGYGQGIPRPECSCAGDLWISPAFDGTELDQRTLDWCVKLVKENPEWRLSAQMHKFMRIR
jgi:7-carboxy-7-deazaguanine synthase